MPLEARLANGRISVAAISFLSERYVCFGGLMITHVLRIVQIQRRGGEILFPVFISYRLSIFPSPRVEFQIHVSCRSQ